MLSPFLVGERRRCRDVATTQYVCRSLAATATLPIPVGAGEYVQRNAGSPHYDGVPAEPARPGRHRDLRPWPCRRGSWSIRASHHGVRCDAVSRKRHCSWPGSSTVSPSDRIVLREVSPQASSVRRRSPSRSASAITRCSSMIVAICFPLDHRFTVHSHLAIAQ